MRLSVLLLTPLLGPLAPYLQSHSCGHCRLSTLSCSQLTVGLSSPTPATGKPLKSCLQALHTYTCSSLILAVAQLFAKLIWQMSPCFEIPWGLLGLICLVDIVGNSWKCSWPVWRSCWSALQAVMLSLAAPSALCAQLCFCSGSLVSFL